MKKVLVLVLTLVMSLSLTACGNDGNFEKAKTELVDLMKSIGNDCDSTSSSIITMWNNVINSDVDNVQMSLCYGAVTTFTSDMSKAEYDEKNGSNVYVRVWSAALAVAPEKVTGLNHNEMTDEAQEETIDICYAYNSKVANINSSVEKASEKLKTFKEAYSNNHSEECSLLSEWFVELKQYAEFATAPTGSYTTYTSKQKDYQDSVAKYQTKAEIL